MKNSSQVKKHLWKYQVSWIGWKDAALYVHEHRWIAGRTPAYHCSRLVVLLETHKKDASPVAIAPCIWRRFSAKQSGASVRLGPKELDVWAEFPHLRLCSVFLKALFLPLLQLMIKPFKPFL